MLLERLGRDRYGSIYKALDRSLSEALLGVEHHVALQELHPRVAAQPILLERLEQLPRHPQSWSHPNLVKLLEFGRDGAKLFLSTELLEGASLRVVLDDNASEPLAYHEVLGVLRAVGDALNYAHVKGIVHGDVRPENVFVTSSYLVKLLGLLPCSEPRPAAFFVEDPDNGNRPHPSDDVYGLACLAYELLTGRHPYNGNSPLEALAAGLAPQPVPDLSTLRWQALSRGLALRRERRTASVPEFLAGIGVTGVETVRPVEEPQPQVPQPPLVEPPRWPEITIPSLDPRHRDQAGVTPRPAALATPAAPRAALSEEPPFAKLVFDAQTPTWSVHQPPSTRRSNPVLNALGVLVAAALAVIAYRDHAGLVLQTANLMETSAAFVSAEIEQWQARRGLGAPTVASIDRDASGAAPDEPPAPRAATTDPAPAVPSATLPAPAADDGAVQAIVPETRARTASEAGDARPAVPPAPDAVAPAPAPAQFAFAERTVTVSEGEARARIEILRTGALDTEASVVWSVADRSALGDEDYAVLGARIASFAVGEESQVVFVPLIADSVAERRESFVVNLRAERAGAGAGSQLEVVVLDDDSR